MLQRFSVRSYDPRNVRFGIAGGISTAIGKAPCLPLGYPILLDQQAGLTVDRQDFQMAEEKARKDDVSEQDVPEPDKKSTNEEIDHESDTGNR